MDIHTAAHYMKSGYRVRRLAWTMLQYVRQDHGTLWGAIKLGGAEISISFSLSDLLANDWEIDFRDIIDDSGVEVVYKRLPSDEEE